MRGSRCLSLESQAYFMSSAMLPYTSDSVAAGTPVPATSDSRVLTLEPGPGSRLVFLTDPVGLAAWLRFFFEGVPPMWSDKGASASAVR